MSARSGLVGKKSSWPHLEPSGPTFCVGQKNPTNAEILLIFLGGPMGPIHPVWGHVLVSFMTCPLEKTRKIQVSARAVATHLIPSCVGRGVDLDLRIRPATSGNPGYRWGAAGLQTIFFGPKRVNRAHWPTKDNRQNFRIFWIFPAHAKNGPRWPQMGPGGFFPTNPDLADILGRTDLDFENFYFLFFLGPKFLAWAHLGPTWAHALWAPRGPTHVGPPTLGPDAAAGGAKSMVITVANSRHPARVRSSLE